MSENCTHDCSSCGESCSERKTDFRESLNPHSSVKKVIGIVSGKGGVGKSLVTSLLASAMQKTGHKTAILDADITGPSIPKAFGISEKAQGCDFGILPAVSQSGIDIMSINLLLENDTEPVVWRGPVISGTVKQFWTDVYWNDEEYMFVDMPPGTGDVPLTVFQSLPIAGIIIVTSPQDLVNMIVEKAVNMAAMMGVPILGIVENMSYFKCPDCKKEHYIFGRSKVEEVAARHGIDALAKLPIDASFAKACDDGRIEDVDRNMLKSVVDRIMS